MDKKHIISGLNAILEQAKRLGYLWEDPQILKGKKVEVYELLTDRRERIFVSMNEKGEFVYGSQGTIFGDNPELSVEETYEKLKMSFSEYGSTIRLGSLTNSFARNLLEPISMHIVKDASRLEEEI